MFGFLKMTKEPAAPPPAPVQPAVAAAQHALAQLESGRAGALRGVYLTRADSPYSGVSPQRDVLPESAEYGGCAIGLLLSSARQLRSDASPITINRLRDVSELRLELTTATGLSYHEVLELEVVFEHRLLGLSANDRARAVFGAIIEDGGRFSPVTAARLANKMPRTEESLGAYYWSIIAGITEAAPTAGGPEAPTVQATHVAREPVLV